jgi:linoleate 10R-lipoxygenase
LSDFVVTGESLADQKVGDVLLTKGQRVFLDLVHANSDVSSKESHLYGDGITRSVGVELMTKIVGQMLRAVFEFDGLRRGPAPSGTLKRHNVAEGDEKYTLRYEYLGADNLSTPWPSSMLVQMKAETTNGT